MAALPDAEKLCAQLARALQDVVGPSTAMVGIHTGGAWVAERLHAALALKFPLGLLDPAFYRDDYAKQGLAKEMESARRRLGLTGGGGFGGNPENVRGRIGQLKGAIIGSTSVPTNTQLQQIREVKAALPVVIDQANAIAAKLPGLVKEMLGAGAIFPTLKPISK